MSRLRLGVNIDHVATVRNARGGAVPDPVRAAHLAVEAGADGITAHLREDRRHIRDVDMARLKAELTVPLNFEMAATDEMGGAGRRDPAARRLPGAGEALRAHHRGRPRRDRRPRSSARRHDRARQGRHPRVALHRADRSRRRGGALHRRPGGGAAHRRVVRHAHPRRARTRRARVRAAAARRRRGRAARGSSVTPATGWTMPRPARSPRCRRWSS